MGKRSRKRGIPERSGAGEHGGSASATTRAERDAARRRRAEALERGEAKPRRKSTSHKTSFEDRPPAPWGKFPLVEIVVLIALVLIVWSFFVESSRRAPMLLGGLALGSLAGLELSVREHFNGFRSHSSLLAGAVAAVAITISYFVFKGGGAGIAIVPVMIGGVVFMGAFWVFRQAFARRSGGVGFRR